MNIKTIIGAAAVLFAAGSVSPVLAAGLDGYTTTNLNIRSGPGVRFPPVGVLGAGTELAVHGCLARYTWCDVSASGLRGWVSAGYIEALYGERRVYMPVYAQEATVPVISFEINSYWSAYYPESAFYDELDEWDDYVWEDEGLPPGWHDEWDVYYPR